MVTSSCAEREAAYDGTTQPFPTPIMDHEYLSIKQASERYVVSDVTLRRLAREITREDGHELRELIRPSAAELKQLKEERKPFEYELSTKLLSLRYKEREASAEEGSGGPPKMQDLGRRISIFKLGQFCSIMCILVVVRELVMDEELKWYGDQGIQESDGEVG